jgi:hypothetical protein
MFVGAAVLALCGFQGARASTAYGSLNNFDTVNDTGDVCHGFEIELEDLHTTDISYTFDWNHYGTPKLSEDTTAAGHPRVHVRWESGKKPDGSWAAYTAVPSGVIAPTDGHQFTDPGVNFGGEHFGVGYRLVPGAVRYFWLVDDGNGQLVRGPQVLVSTPVFYVSPGAGRRPAGPGRNPRPSGTRGGSPGPGVRGAGVGQGDQNHHPQRSRRGLARPGVGRPGQGG